MPFNPPPLPEIPSEYLIPEDGYECSDDEFCEQLFEEQCQLRTNNDSIEGFDMSVLPKEYSCTFFLEGEDLIPYLTDLSQLALEKYNRENRTYYQFVKYVKAISNFLDGFVFYIMFEAQQPSENAFPATFTTFIYDGMELEFEFVYMVSGPSKDKEALASSIDEEELSDLRDQFHAIDVDKNGAISLEEMRQALAKDLPWKMKESRVLEILQAIDSNTDGLVDFTEFVAATLHVHQLEEHNSQKWQQVSQAAFEKFDVDRDVGI